MIEKKIVPIHYKKLIKIFELEGFRLSRQKGDHISMTKPGSPRPLIIKTSPRRVPVTHIKTNMVTAGMSRERYFELLEKVQILQKTRNEESRLREELENIIKQDPEMLDIIVLPYELSEQFNSIPPLEEHSLKSIG